MKEFYVYIVASDSGVLYVGMTNNLIRRVFEHKNQLLEGFTKKYKCHKLVYYEIGNDIEKIIEREKQIKKRNRQKKEYLINSQNPTWRDLYEDFIG